MPNLDTPIGRVVQRVAGSTGFARLAPPILTRLDRAVHKVTGGRVQLSRALLPSLMLTTTGRRTGLPRVAPLATLPDGDDLIVVGSNFGREHHPAWSSNLLAEPEATVSYRRETFPVTAHLLTDEEKDAVWPELTKMWPNYDRYSERAGREIRVFRLSRSQA